MDQSALFSLVCVRVCACVCVCVCVSSCLSASRCLFSFDMAASPPGAEGEAEELSIDRCGRIAGTSDCGLDFATRVGRANLTGPVGSRTCVCACVCVCVRACV